MIGSRAGMEEYLVETPCTLSANRTSSVGRVDPVGWNVAVIIALRCATKTSAGTRLANIHRVPIARAATWVMSVRVDSRD